MRQQPLISLSEAEVKVNSINVAQLGLPRYHIPSLNEEEGSGFDLVVVGLTPQVVAIQLIDYDGNVLHSFTRTRADVDLFFATQDQDDATPLDLVDFMDEEELALMVEQKMDIGDAETPRIDVDDLYDFLEILREEKYL